MFEYYPNIHKPVGLENASHCCVEDNSLPDLPYGAMQWVRYDFGKRDLVMNIFNKSNERVGRPIP